MVMKTPGVYIVEKSAFPNSVVQVATAIPAFIGYTEKAMNGNVPLHLTPMKINSFSEFETYFGGPPVPYFTLSEFAEREGLQPYGEDADQQQAAELPQAVFTTNGPRGLEKFELKQVNPAHLLYAAMRLFYSNGGGSCFVVSIGTYDDPIEPGPMLKALTRLEKETEPTMVVIPETTRLNRQDSANVQQQMMRHCGEVMKNRFAILDIHGGYLDERSPRGDPVASFRNDAGTNNLDYAAAYYPWLDTSVFTSRVFTYENIVLESRGKFISLLKRSVNSNKQIVEEIKKVGTAVLTGDFTISVKSGGSTVLKPGDISARDDTTEAGALSYKVETREGEMPGKLVRKGSTDPVAGFTQKEIEAGVISFEHDAAQGPRGSFSIVVTDEDGVQTEARTVAIVAGNEVLALPDVVKGTSVKIDVGSAGGDAGSVRLVGADPIDEVAVRKADQDVIAAKDAVDKAADKVTDAQTKKLADAEAAAVVKVKDKTLTLRGIGVWQVDGSAISFAPAPELRDSEVAVKYTVDVKGETQPPQEIRVLLDGIDTKPPAPSPSTATVDKTMRAIVPLYNDVMNSITRYMNAMSPAAAMAGLYTMVDNSRGVWKAPANVSVNSVVAPMVNIDNLQQENLNVSTTGKSINAIRPFVGEGTLVWGARTLDGNSLDWRYINVRRTMIMIEESIRLAAKAYVFEPNTANTWVTIRSMLENFLTSVWKAGGLAGAVPEDAFSVHVGLGETMTPVDILEGRLLITVLVAVVRPAEFIEITFQQQMQKS
ncbi:phage tail sheath C-terminal domain-containing protein [Paracoccus marinaquae]|uniref:Phage tail protein n=1 Tax=Paracoccus marinaquae TaxID=2841926 RepID=A0ABS6AKD5_9RHOB|nr:phage tail sheath C-terminal domain-containing protein [Paracoccus marinaquae]MBU3030114.1 phage tail protein [Paracoccus marinaquae]